MRSGWAEALGVFESTPGDINMQLQGLELLGFPGGASGKEPVPMQETREMQVLSLGWEDPLEEGMATHSSILVWRIPWTEEPGRLQSMGLQRVG